MRFTVTESERVEILKMYGVYKEEITPLQRLSECKITTDGKYIIYEGKAYSSETGDEILINEAWTLSDYLHTGADLLSASADFLIPGSGAVVDTLNAISYLIESQFKPPEQRSALYIMAGITFAFVVLPGPLQLISIPLKRAIKTGVGFASPVVQKGIKIVARNMDKILAGVPNAIERVMKTKFGRKILGKWGPKVKVVVEKFSKQAKTFFDNMSSKILTKTTTKATAKGMMSGKARNSLLSYFKKMPRFRQGDKILRKAGFVPGRTYRYMGPKGMTTGTIKSVANNQVEIIFKNGTKTVFPAETFVKNAIGAPWIRKGAGVGVPLFIKRFSDMMLPDGSNIDETQLDKIEDLNPEQTSQESLGYTQEGEGITAYQGDTGQYTINKNITNFQTALDSLGYKLPQYGIDGKFGTETMSQLKKFQIDNGFPKDRIGKMDSTTAKKMAELLKNKNIPNSEETQKALTSI